MPNIAQKEQLDLVVRYRRAAAMRVEFILACARAYFAKDYKAASVERSLPQTPSNLSRNLLPFSSLKNHPRF